MNTPIVALPTIKLPPPSPEDKIAKSVEKPNAFSKPASTPKGAQRGTRIRPGNYKDTGPKRTGRRRKDPRYVRFY